MASLKSGRADCAYPPELAVFDPARWTRHEWHLARAYAAPTRLDALNEIRASVGVPPLEVWPAELRIGARLKAR